MSGYPETDETDLGVQAFQDMSRAMNQLNGTLRQAREQKLLDANKERSQSSNTIAASKTAERAAEMALKATQEALQAARIQIRSSLLWTTLLGLVAALVGVSGGYYIGRDSGWAEGHAVGYASAQTDKAATNWANTPSGLRAFALDQVGSLDMLTRCTGKGWEIEKQQGRRVCFPLPNSQGTAGWFLAPASSEP